jgi:hypothetical protein
VARKQRVPSNAKRTSIYLSIAQEHALATIEHERRHRNEGRDSPSEIIADAIWRLGESYNVRRKEVEARFPDPPPKEPKNNITVISKGKKKR